MNSRADNPSPEDLLSHAGWIRNLARSLCRDSARADDLVQRTWIAALEHGDQRRGSAPAWLAAVLLNFARQENRSEGARAQRERSVARREELPSDDELLERLEQQRLIVELVSRLSEARRTVVILHYYEGLSAVDIAHRLGEKPGTIRQRLRRALGELRERLDEGHGGREAWLSALTPLAKLTPAVPPGTTGVLLGSALVMKQALLAAALVVLVGGALYFSREDSPANDMAALEQPDPSRAGAIGQAGNEPELADELQSVNASSARSGPTVTLPAQPHWRLAGRVQWPAHSAAEDSTLEVFAWAEEISYSEFVREFPQLSTSANDASPLLARALVAADGRFELELPASTDRAHLILRGRYLYSERTLECANAAAADTPVIVAQAGAWIHGELLAPASLQDSDLSGIPLRFASEVAFEDGMTSTGFRVTVVSDDDGRFEVRAAPPLSSTSLLAMPRDLAALTTDLGATLPFEERALRLQLLAGGSLEGRVVDAAGDPVGGARVRGLLAGKIFGFDDDDLRSSVSAANGSFRLEALPPGEVHVTANKTGYLESSKLPTIVANERTHSGLVIALSQGQSLSGSVSFEDGAPAADVLVEADFDESFALGPAAFNRLRGAHGEKRSDAEGRFRIEGLGSGPFVVSAKLQTEAGRLHARLDGRRPGGASSSLVLVPAQTIRGRVIDAAGADVDGFVVHATRISEGAIGEMESGSERQGFEAADGQFALGGLQTGRWHVVVSASGFAASERQVIDLPGASAPLNFVLEGPCAISGTVVSADGQPVSGALVSIDTGLSPLQAELLGGLKAPNDRSDENGYFRLEGLRAGPLAIRAKATGFAWSESVPVVLAPAEERGAVSLVMRRGGRISGEAYDDGEPAAHRMVNLIQWGQSQFDSRMSETDGEGRFVLENVEAGHWHLLVIESRNSSLSSSNETPMNSILDSMLTAQVVVEEGSDQHVVLGSAPRKPVRVHGRVTRNGKAYGDLGLHFQSGSGESSGGSVVVSVGSDGRYEVVVDGGGPYLVSINWLGNAASEVSVLMQRCAIPDEPECELDFEVPGGGIAGRVVDERGEPVAQARLTLQPSPRAGIDQVFAPRFIESASGPVGEFEFENLAAGSYTIFAGGAGRTLSGELRVHSRVASDDLLVEADRWLRGVQLRLPDPGTLAIEVKDYLGNPEAGAAIFVRSEAGHLVDALARVHTSDTGEAVYAGLAPGNYTVFARTPELAAREVAVVVRKGETGSVALELEPGSWLDVRTLDDAGDELGCVLTVLDAEGREVSQAFVGMLQATERMKASISGEQRIGPLPPDSYRVNALAATGAQDSKRVRLSDGTDRRVTLRLKAD